MSGDATPGSPHWHPRTHTLESTQVPSSNSKRSDSRTTNTVPKSPCPSVSSTVKSRTRSLPPSRLDTSRRASPVGTGLGWFIGHDVQQLGKQALVWVQARWRARDPSAQPQQHARSYIQGGLCPGTRHWLARQAVPRPPAQKQSTHDCAVIMRAMQPCGKYNEC
jgi:hypothetical protein